jgi:predicted Zn-dependent protease with MMP-like domain/Flp pilus assembly protein TadD
MQDPDRYWDCLDQAVEASGGGRVEEALQWLDEALRANPQGTEAHNGRGEILWDNGRYDEALREFELAVVAAPDFNPAQLNRVEILIEEFQEYEDALDLCDNLLAYPLERGAEAEVYYLKAKALFYLDDLEGALFLLRRAIQAHGEVGVYRGFEGQILFEMGRFREARRSLERSLVLDPDSGHTVYHIALVREHMGELEEAEGLFARAANLAPDLYPLPVRIEPGEFEDAANKALSSLPAKLRGYIQNCPILIEDLPSEELIRGEQTSPQLLGLFQGVPATEAGASPTMGTAARVDTDRIVLFKRNLEKIALDRASLIEQIQITVQHEIGHYLGLDEDQIDRLGLA